MQIGAVNNNINFKGYIPVRYYSKEQGEETVYRITSKENIKKCQGYVVRNLNRTLKEHNEGFVDMYKAMDKDYRKHPVVRSYYGKNGCDVFLVTGYDADRIDEMAKPIGIAKGDAKSKTGKAKSYESRNASRNFFSNVESYLKNQCRRIKNNNGEKLVLNVLFEPTYNKKNEFKKFKYLAANFTCEK